MSGEYKRGWNRYLVEGIGQMLKQEIVAGGQAMKQYEDPLQVLQRCECDSLLAMSLLVPRSVMVSIPGRSSQVGMVVGGSFSPGLYLLQVDVAGKIGTYRLEQLRLTQVH